MMTLHTEIPWEEPRSFREMHLLLNGQMRSKKRTFWKLSGARQELV